MSIHIITTVGTIEGFEYNSEKDKPKGVSISIKDFFRSANVSFDYTLESAFNKDSRFISDKDREVIAEKVIAAKAQKILITHGTITMVETATYLASVNLDKTIVLVGSFILGSEKHTDAPFNLSYAVCALEHLKNGTYIAMNGNVFPWNDVVKNQELNRFERISTK